MRADQPAWAGASGEAGGVTTTGRTTGYDERATGLPDALALRVG